ncbi:MAG: FecR family protein [Sulfuritalea sp.]|nr:FecR family protein [Sulfuritalea sp.]MDP1982572.1 FecR family protein [Sulfuritalea sp.]
MFRSRLVSALLIFFLSAAVEAGAATAGRVASLSGSLMAAKLDGRKVALAVNSPIDTGDTLHTDSTAWALVRFNDGSVVTIKPDSRFQVQEFDFEESDPARDNIVLVLVKGGLRAVTGLIGKRHKPGAYRLRTLTATIGIRGTDYGVQYCSGGDCAGKKTLSGEVLADGLHLEVFEGGISVTNDAGSIDLAVGQFGYVKDHATLPVAGSDGYHDPGAAPRAGECALD